MQNRRGLGCGCALAVLLLLLLLLVGLYFWWRSRVPPPPTPSGGELHVRVLDVGQGDAILIRTPAGKIVAVDAGPPGSGKVVLDAMNREGATQIDLFIATHAHADHIGGADEVINATKVLRVLDSKVPNATKNYEDFLKAVNASGAQYIAASPGQNFDLGDGAVIHVLAPLQPFFTKEQLRSGGNEPNANSVVVRLDYGDFSILLTGDAEAQTEERIMANGGGGVAADVLKVGHHGSKYASSDNFLRAGRFRDAIISDGADNRYGHPSQEVLDRLRALGIKVYRTDLQGEITVTTRGSGYEIKTARAAASDLWTGRVPQRDDSSRVGFVAYGDFGPPPKQKRKAAGTR
ncbi:MAG TPA: ComEC/Rec2 family competence protein [Pyrinomonadaceae bacterium]|nr:ComEC/Rec2 family competence protein [Pyrinomonadaceae bacterium]